jgi:hypothetical protein
MMLTVAEINPTELAAWIAAGVGLVTLLGAFVAVGRKLDQATDAYQFVRKQMASNGSAFRAGTAGLPLRDAVDAGTAAVKDLQAQIERRMDSQEAATAEQFRILTAALTNAVARDDERFKSHDRRLDDHDAELTSFRRVVRDHDHPDVLTAIEALRTDVMAEFEQIRSDNEQVRGDIVALYKRTESQP